MFFNALKGFLELDKHNPWKIHAKIMNNGVLFSKISSQHKFYRLEDINSQHFPTKEESCANYGTSLHIQSTQS